MVHINEIRDSGMSGHPPPSPAPEEPPSQALVLHTTRGEPHSGIAVGSPPRTAGTSPCPGGGTEGTTFCVSMDSEHRAALSDAYIRDTLDAFPIKPEEVTDVRGPYVQLTRVSPSGQDAAILDVSITHQFRAHFGKATPALRNDAESAGLIIEELDAHGVAGGATTGLARISPAGGGHVPSAVRLSAFSDDSFTRELDQLSTMSSSPRTRSSLDDPTAAASGDAPISPNASAAYSAAAAWEIDPSLVHIGHRIAVGGHGEVFVGKYQGTLVAVKLLLALDEPAKARFRREIATLMSLRHPNLILFMGYTASPHLAIVSEYMSRGSLFRILRRGGREGGAGKPLEPRLTRTVALSVARGMCYLHSLNPPLIHLDLKSPNILVDDKWRVKIADFGLSRSRFSSALSGTGAGTPEWMAPEVIRSEKHDEKADVYSYGVVLWECLTGEPPWEGLHPMQVVAAVGFQNKTLPRPTGDDVEMFLADLAMRCMAADPAERPGFPEILEALEAELEPRHVHSMLSTLSEAGSAATLAAPEPVLAAVEAPAARDALATSPFAGSAAASPKAAALGPEDSAAAMQPTPAAATAPGLSLDTPFAGLAPFSDDNSDDEGEEAAAAVKEPSVPPAAAPSQPTVRLSSGATTTDRSFELPPADLSAVSSLKSTLDDVGRWGGRAPQLSPTKASTAAADTLLAAAMASAQL